MNISTVPRQSFQILHERWIEQASNPGAVLAIPSNGYIRQDGRAVMGIGYAAQAKRRFKGIDLRLGSALENQGRMRGNFGHIKTEAVGNLPTIIWENPTCVSFPVQWHFAHKYKKKTPAPCDPGLIDRSLINLVEMATYHKWPAIYIPKLGWEEGVTDWEHEVLPYIRDYLDDRFILCYT